MKFDKSRVYTALNADELKVGSKVIVADSVRALKNAVKDEDACILQRIASESNAFRFIISSKDSEIPYSLAYLVEEPEEEKLEWFELRIGDVIIKDGTIAMVTQIDEGAKRSHIRAGDMWIPDVVIGEWKRWKNENPCRTCEGKHFQHGCGGCKEVKNEN